MNVRRFLSNIGFLLAIVVAPLLTLSLAHAIAFGPPTCSGGRTWLCTEDRD